MDLTDLDMRARAVPYEEFGRPRREASVTRSRSAGPSRFTDETAPGDQP
ncbi:MAG TPA: hypothetical protein VMK84_26385 [Streptosporangiaceae bacterium]|nr:hypothetical protein [Streptosporangiaceae bacterium]